MFEASLLREGDHGVVEGVILGQANLFLFSLKIFRALLPALVPRATSLEREALKNIRKRDLYKSLFLLNQSALSVSIT